MRRKKKEKVVEEIVEQPVVEEVIEEPKAEEIVEVAPVLGHAHEELPKHFMTLKSNLGYLPKVGEIISYKGSSCKVVRIKLNKIFLCRVD